LTREVHFTQFTVNISQSEQIAYHMIKLTFSDQIKLKQK